MVNERQILRLVEAQEYRRLVERVLENGRCPSPLVRRQMSLSEAVAPVGLGLALQRLSEMTYAPCNGSALVAQQLLLLQRHDGSFGSGIKPARDAVLASTAVAVRGLMACVDQCRANAQKSDPRIVLAIEKGLAALVRMFGPRERLAENAVGWAIVTWQLGESTRLRAMIPMRSLMSIIEETLGQSPQDDLIRYARAAAA